MKKLACLLPLVAALAACGNEAPPVAPPVAETQTAPADQPAQPVPPQRATDAFTVKLDKVLAGEWRSDANKARDAYRHPKQTLEFFGLKSGDTVVEITPGGGWYAEVLAPLLQGDGKYIGALVQDSASDYARNSNEKLRAIMKDHAAQFGAAELVEFDPKAPSLGAPGSADVVLTFRNVHNWGDNAPVMFKAFFDVLKPGGTLGVVEHRAAAGADPDKIKDSGYLPREYVVKLATDAGFQLVAESEINANAKDTKDYEKGVWTLPPNLALKDQDREKYLAIGESDRMTLKFTKPKGDQIFSQGDAPKE